MILSCPVPSAVRARLAVRQHHSYMNHINPISYDKLHEAAATFSTPMGITLLNMFVPKSLIICCMIAASLVCSGVAHAQGDTYYCDFEDENENLTWVLNDGFDGESCANKWYIGVPGNNGGANSLYISGDGGVSASYTGTPTFVVAQKTITLPAGTYELSFDWQAWGINNDALYVSWIPATVQTSSVASGFKPKWFTDNSPVVMDDTIAMNCDSWHTAYGTIVSDGTPHKLVFSWHNEQNVNNPSAAVDNITILPVGRCARPERLELEADSHSVQITWRGEAQSYDLRVLAADGVWREYAGLTSTTMTVSDLPEGGVWVYVRGNCADGYTSAWTSGSTFVFMRGVRCVDYLDLKAADCYVGTFDAPRFNNYMVDEGYRSIESRQTIHYDQNERDPRTGMAIKTVPDGELASVRLGNWDVNRGAESIDYRYLVDEDASAVLLLKYAVVMQDPKHSKEEQPRFTLKVLHSDESMIDEYGCGEADFFSGVNTEEWDSVGSGTSAILFKDWTMVGINLKDYAGQELIIRLTTYDCAEGGHYGYAYFVLGCSDGKILGLSCGESEENSFKAPDGFKYRWYEKKDPTKTVLDSAQVFTTDRTDTVIYCCDVIQPTKGECYYTVEANATPRYPVAEMRYTVEDNRCQNIVSFADSSYIMHVNPFTGDTTIAEEECDSVLWDFGDGSEVSREFNPTHIYPDEGGSYTVTMTAYLSECENSSSVTIDLPESGSIRDTIYMTSCNGYGVEFGGETVKKEGWYRDTVYNYRGEGCDSITFLYLTEGRSSDSTVYDTTCTDRLPYEFLGEQYYTTGTYSHTLTLTNGDGCDSVITLNLTVNEALEVTTVDKLTVCADDVAMSLPVDVVQGSISSFDFTLDGVDEMTVTGGSVADGAAVIALPENLSPGEYTGEIIFMNSACGDVTQRVTVDVYYPDSIVAQRWNDVLGVRSAAWNGGYEFDRYQWYKDGMPIEGETGANLYAADGLDAGAQYSVLLRRAADGVEIMTCPVQPEMFSDIEVIPTVTFSGGSIEVKSGADGTLRVWSVAGVLQSVHDIKDGVNTIDVPAAEGTYILEVQLKDGIRKVEKIVVYRQ